MSIADRIAIMDAGELEQVGPPEEIYREPRNEFIAGFLGDPPMNLLAVRADGAEPTLSQVADSLPSGTRRVGIRPEDVYPARADGTVRGGDAPMSVTDPVECTVSVVEPTGRAYELTLRTGDREFMARRRSVPDDVREADATHVVFDREKLYAFDEAGSRIA